MVMRYQLLRTKMSFSFFKEVVLRINAFSTENSALGLSGQVALGLRSRALWTFGGDGWWKDLRWGLRKQCAGHEPWPCLGVGLVG